MVNISDLSNDLLVKILLLIPSKVAVSTSLLSKRWGSVWKLIPKLDYDDTYSASASEFIGKFLQLNNAPILESLYLRLKRDYAPEDYETWVNVAVTRKVPDIELLRYCIHFIPLPMSLYTHETLVVLRLMKVTIDDVPSTTCFRSLKTLSLLDVFFTSDKTVERLLSCFPILETLVVDRWGGENVKTFAICVPSLQSLKIRYRVGGYHDPKNDHGFVINAPSLKYLDIVDHFSGFYSLVNMPEQLDAEIHVRHCDSETLLGYLTSSKKLSLCLKPQMGSYPEGDFDQLVSLDLCVMCSLDWLNLILSRSPKLRALRLYQSRERGGSCRNSRNVRTKWEQPSSVPECLLVSLKTVEWILYKGTQEEKDVVKYLLENGNFIKTMSIGFSSVITLEERNKIQLEFESMPRSSRRCQLSFT
ncbi:putative FBD-associated F-box protein At5g56430 [Arabidopsis lyrata subsp. lyrata]|uniref:putative FBD-associated F-box protein At5g56430 n=1 Tax=Arabidopsis lyrata subsp. lyrata TaxID=81972 RepID=UPI000A29E606|nr:putative FBD-associated F-box protein At5g56430 [Arabidopsis lyrata subsp. lyrata]XP_020871062.1 putative FBD-associated F-box protein At5g56430 [Arabidopsis lyrata subsp. lyrata]|eukprot:XP_020871061.1 putative FBD-associated F-box protein At5g56430 [Arabidopsis lyrata subsp. lyrata]